MFAGGITDVGRVGMSRIGADIDDAPRLTLTLEIPLEVLGHHQRNSTTVYSEVRIDALSRRQVHTEPLLRDQCGIEGFENTVGMVVDEDIHRSQFTFTAVE